MPLREGCFYGLVLFIIFAKFIKTTLTDVPSDGVPYSRRFRVGGWFQVGDRPDQAVLLTDATLEQCACSTPVLRPEFNFWGVFDRFYWEYHCTCH